jgi:insulysin
VTADLLVKILTEPAFSVLRTQEQLGYVVMCNIWSLPGSSEKGIRIVVQSGKQPGYLEQRVEAFLHKMKELIEQMSDDAFQEYKAGLEKRWLESDKNLTEEAARFMAHIGSGQLDFMRSENDASMLKNISKNDVLELFLSRIYPSSTTRAKISVHMHSQKPPKRISTEAAQAFASLTREAGHKVPDEDWMEIMGADGTATPEEFARHWAGLLGGVEKAKSLFASLPALVLQYPVEGEGEDITQPDAQYIQDFETFKSAQRVTVHHGPFVEWGDLPISHL